MIKNNKGISLFEMLIVLAIMSVVTGLAALSLSLVNSANVSKAADTYAAAVNTARTTSMAKGTALGTLHVVKEGSGAVYYYIGNDPTVRHMICKNPVETSLPAGNTLDVTFNSAGMVTSGGNVSFLCNKKKAIVSLSTISGKANTSIVYMP